MKKIISLIYAVVFITLSFTSCSLSPEQQKKYVKRLQNQNQDWILKNFTENEETFNKLADILFRIYEDIDDPGSIKLYYKSSKSYGSYVLYITEYVGISGEKKPSRGREENFFVLPLSEAVTEEELNKIFLAKKDYNSNTQRAKSNVKKYTSFSVFGKHGGEFQCLE